MAGKRFILNAGRTSKQGQQINIGKDNDEYEAIVNTLTMHPDDMKELNIPPEEWSGSGPSTAGRAPSAARKGRSPQG